MEKKSSTFTYTDSLALRSCLVQCIEDVTTAQSYTYLVLEDWKVESEDDGGDASEQFPDSDLHFSLITDAIRQRELYLSKPNWLEQISSGNDELLICLLLLLCENVTRLSFCAPYGSDFLHDAFKQPNRLANIEEVSITYWDTEGGYSLQEIEPILRLPKLRKLACHLLSEETPDEFIPTEPQVNSTLQDFDVHYSNVNPEALARFLTLCPKLQVLNYDENSITPPADFVSALVSVPSLCEGLVELRLSCFHDSVQFFGPSRTDTTPRHITYNGTKASSRAPVGDDAGYTFPPQRCFGSFASFQGLHILHVQFPQMLKHGPNRQLTLDLVEDWLPKKIVQVKFTDVSIKDNDLRHQDRLVEFVELMRSRLLRWEVLIVDVELERIPRLVEVCHGLGLNLVYHLWGPLSV